MKLLAYWAQSATVIIGLYIYTVKRKFDDHDNDPHSFI
jgi:hypothetical protein